MATFKNARLYDKKVRCPYNSAHVLTEVTIAKHLIKCQKNHPEIVLQKCPFNATHRVKQSEYLEHIQTCVDRDCVDVQLLEHRDPNKIKGALAVPAYNKTPDALMEPSENWEDEIPSGSVFSFDPSLNQNIKYLDVTKLTTKSKKEKLKIYNNLHMQQDYERPENIPSRPVKPQPAPTAVSNPPKQSSSTAIRRPTQEFLSGKINSHYIGLGRGSSRRCAANIGLPQQGLPPSTLLLDSLNSMSGVQNPTANVTVGRGRALSTRDTSDVRQNNFIKKVTVPPGFEKNQAHQRSNQVPSEATCDLLPLAEGEIGTVPDEVNPEKQKRKLEKKLKQIENLINLQGEGQELTDEEAEKVSKLDDIKYQLQNLKL